jgi:hypothetical protein
VAEFGEGEELVGDEGDDGVEADEHHLRHVHRGRLRRAARQGRTLPQFSSHRKYYLWGMMGEFGRILWNDFG